MVVNKEKIKEYSVLRVLAMALVVIGHCQIFYIGNIQFDIPKTTLYYIVEIIVEMIYKFHMPLFFFLSGAMYYISTNYRGKYVDFKELIVNKYHRLIVPYFAVSFFMLIPMRILLGVYTRGNIVQNIIYDIVLLHDAAHLWFLPILFMVFILFWAIEKLFRSSFAKYAVVMAVYIVALIIPDKYDLSLRYLLWFTLGYAFESIRRKYNEFIRGKNPVLCIVFIIMFATLFVVNINNSIINLLINNMMALNGILLTYSVSVFLAKNNIMKLNVFKVLDKYNFEIYLFHDIFNYLVLYILKKIGLLDLLRTNFLYSILIFVKIVGVTILSILLARLYKRLKG